jgi:hypothetical protein
LFEPSRPPQQNPQADLQFFFRERFGQALIRPRLQQVKALFQRETGADHNDAGQFVIPAQIANGRSRVEPCPAQVEHKCFKTPLA